MSGKIKEIQEKFSDFTESLKDRGKEWRNWAVYSYIPLVGWIYPYFFRKEEELSQFHAKQAMQLNVISLIAYFVIWILEYFPITAIFFGPGSILHPISRTIWLVVFFGYVALSGVGAYQAHSNRNWEIPYLKKGVDKIMDYVKSLRKKS